MNAPANFPTLAITINPSAISSELWIPQDGQVGRQTGDAEEHRHEESEDEAAQLLVDVLA